MPLRSSIDPTQIVNLVPRLFMLGRLGPGHYQFRLVGDFLGDLYGRDLRGDDFLRVWRLEDRISLQMAMEAVRRRAEPLVVEAEARTDAGVGLRLEIAMAPIMGADGEASRFLGLYQPVSPAPDLLGHTLTALSIRAITTPDTEESAFPRLRLAAANGARL